MNKKIFILVNTCVIAVATIATAIVTYFEPQKYVLIISAIGIATSAISDCLALFIKDDKEIK